MALPPSGMSDEAFLREVDEEYRRDQAARLVQRYGRWIVGAVVVLLAALAGFLYYQHQAQEAAGRRGIDYDTALQSFDRGQPAQGLAGFGKLAAQKTDGYSAMARIAEGNDLLGRRDTKAAITKFAEVANNSAYPQPYRDLALIRQTAAEFDALPPQTVIDRLKDLANPNSPWLGTAGEMVAAAYLKTGNRAEAGRRYAQLAQAGEEVPQSIRARARELAGSLGVDAIDQSKESKAQ